MEPEKRSLDNLIDICADPDNPQWQNGWLQLLERYRDLIFYFINRSCDNWHIARLNLQKSDVIDDIFMETLGKLHLNLKSFQNRDSEQKFISWLQIVCNRSTSHYLQRVLKNMLSEDSIDGFEDYRDSYSGIKSWELYENIISLLRQQLKKNKLAERDIHIFMLSVWSGFTPRQILQHPCFTDLQQNTIEVIISRIRKKLKNFVSV